ncbi:MAG: hypothetical protein PHF58_14050 [Methylotenera sp.]|nr:hypothetical protein [Methylotenera sp.]
MFETIDLVRFRLQQGKTAADWLKANEQIDAWAKRQPGFRFRSLSETADGEWIDMTYWESMAAAQAGQASFGAEMMQVCEPLVAPESVVACFSRVHVMQRG